MVILLERAGNQGFRVLLHREEILQGFCVAGKGIVGFCFAEGEPWDSASQGREPQNFASQGRDSASQGMEHLSPTGKGKGRESKVMLRTR